MCSRSGPIPLFASDGMGMLKLALMSALSSSSPTRMGEVGLGEAMEGYFCSTGILSAVDLLSEISGVIPFGL